MSELEQITQLPANQHQRKYTAPGHTDTTGQNTGGMGDISHSSSIDLYRDKRLFCHSRK